MARNLTRDTDPALAMAFENALRGNALARGTRTSAGGPFPNMMAAAARFLAAPQGARVAMCELGGWDTHVNQMAPLGALGEDGSARCRAHRLDQSVAATAECHRGNDPCTGFCQHRSQRRLARTPLGQVLLGGPRRHLQRRYHARLPHCVGQRG